MDSDKKCHDCRWWDTRQTPRERASMGLCTHLSCYRRGTPSDYYCALHAPAVEAPALAPTVIARCPKCGCTSFTVLICNDCGATWTP